MASPKEYIEKWIPGFDGHNFYTRTYAATFPKAVLLFVHGFVEHVGRYEHAHVKYPAHNITVFAYDLRGYGRTALDSTHKSKDAAYGKTNWAWQIQDIEFFAQYLAKEYPGTPLFLMGHSAGGGQVLAYFTRPSAPPKPENTKLFKAVILSSPLVVLTHPKPKLVRWTGSKLALLRPYQLIPADVGIENVTRNVASREAYAKDPMIKKWGSLKALDDMLSGGEKILAEDYKRWPKDLPVFFVVGTEDQVTSPKAIQELHDKLDATDKKLSLYEGGYHELVQEPDGMSERFTTEVIDWIEAHVPQKRPVTPSPAATPAQSQSKL